MDRGEKLYTAWRDAMNAAHNRRCHRALECRWKDLKPWVKQVWAWTEEATSVG